MKYRYLPKTDLEISEIGFGCMSLNLANNNEFLLQKAFDRGINYFDTADLYDRGKNEETVGRALNAVRKDVILATKVGNEWLPDGSSWRWNPTKKYILEAVDQSLTRLQTDYIDIYQLHGGTIEDPIDEVIEAFEQLKQLGKIRYYGISSIRPNVIREYTSKSNIVSDMLQYSLLDRRPEEEMLDYLDKHKIGVMVRGALAKGLLAGKPASDYLDYSKEEVKQVVNAMTNSTSKNTLGQIALKYVLGSEAVTSAIVGIRTDEQLEDAVSTSASPNLSIGQRSKLASILQPNRYTQHR